MGKYTRRNGSTTLWIRSRCVLASLRSTGGSGPRLLPSVAMPRPSFIRCRIDLGLVVLATALAMAACGNDAARTRSLKLGECRLPNLSTLARCGEIDVPEDRSKPDGRKIKIFAAVLPASTLSPK